MECGQYSKRDINTPLYSLNNYEKVIKKREKVLRLEKKVYLCSGIIMYLDTTYGEKGSRFVVEL